MWETWRVKSVRFYLKVWDIACMGIFIFSRICGNRFQYSSYRGPNIHCSPYICSGPTIYRGTTTIYWGIIYVLLPSYFIVLTDNKGLRILSNHFIIITCFVVILSVGVKRDDYSCPLIIWKKWNIDVEFQGTEEKL